MRAKKIIAMTLWATIGFGSHLVAQTKLTAENIDQVIQEMTLEEKCHLVLGQGMPSGSDAKFPGTAGSSYAIHRLGIPSIYCADSNQGLRMAAQRDFDSRRYVATDFMTSISLAASWNKEAAYEVGAAIGNETKEYGLDWILAPSMNLIRNVLCGRNHEYYSEDPYLSGSIAAAYVKGVQSEGTAACLKHFVANNQETNRVNNDARISQRALRELYLKAFEIAVKESHPWTIMTAYNKVNGTYTPESKPLIETILRGEWGYEGMVVSDWNAGTNAVQSMLAGNDMMQPGQERQYQTIHEAVLSGELPVQVLDNNVKRILQLIVKTNSFKKYAYSNEPDLKRHAQADRAWGAECMVLLKNEGVLPFDSRVKDIALYGTTSYDIIPGGTGFGGMMNGQYTVSLVEGLRAQGYAVNNGLLKQYKAHIDKETKRLYPNGRPAFSIAPLNRAEELSFPEEELKSYADSSHLAIITIGRKSGEAVDRIKESFYLSEGEQKLIRQVSEAYHDAGKKVLVILNICSPIETASWKESVDGIVCAWQTGEQIGHSIADVLSGKVTPSGKLPVTFALHYGDAAADKRFPSDFDASHIDIKTVFGFGDADKSGTPTPDIDYTDYEEDIYVGYRYFDSFGKSVSYPFGYGLSYTTFEYLNPTIEHADNQYTIRVEVKNSGNHAGKEVVELFVSAPRNKQLDKPAKELKAFAKTGLLKPGESEVVTMTVSQEDLASFNEKKSAWQTSAGTYDFLLCASAADVKSVLKADVKASMRKVNDVMEPQYKLNLLHR